MFTTNQAKNSSNNSNNIKNSTHFSNAFLTSPVTSKANFYSSLYNGSPPPHHLRSANGTFHAFSQRVKSHPPVTSYADNTAFQSIPVASPSNVLPTSRPSPIFRSPLSIMGYRTDVSNSQQKSTFPSTKSPKTTINRWSYSSHVVKPLAKTYNYRWKIKSSTNAGASNYPDPLYNANEEYMQRITEMAGLEVETIKGEKSRSQKTWRK